MGSAYSLTGRLTSEMPPQIPFNLLSILFTGEHSTVHPVDVLGGSLVDVAICVPVRAVFVTGPYPSPTLWLFFLLLAEAVLLASKQRRKKGPFPPHCY